MKILILGRALLPSTPSLGNLPPDVLAHIEASYNDKVRFPTGLIPSAPYAGRRYFALAFTLAKIADLKFYGPGYPEYKESWLPSRNEIDVLGVIKRVYDGDYPDAIIELSPANPEGLHGCWVNFEAVQCLRMLWAADFHNDIGHPGVIDEMRAGRWNLVIKSWDLHNRTEYSEKVQKTGVPMAWLPFSIDPNVFRDYQLKKVYDVINMGTFSSSYYPLRQAIHIRMMSVRDKIKYLCGYDFLTEQNNLAGVMTDEYARIINQGRMYTTCTSTFKYAGMKLLEIMACNTLLLCDTPLDAEELGFKSLENYVEIDTNNFMERITHYLNHQDEASQIAQNGYKLVHSRHTNEIRAKEFLDILSRYRK
jgi:hypothetical protein